MTPPASRVTGAKTLPGVARGPAAPVTARHRKNARCTEKRKLLRPYGAADAAAAFSRHINSTARSNVEYPSISSIAIGGCERSTRTQGTFFRRAIRVPIGSRGTTDQVTGAIVRRAINNAFQGARVDTSCEQERWLPGSALFFFIAPPF